LLNALRLQTTTVEILHRFEAVQKPRRCASISAETSRFQGGVLNEHQKFVTECLARRSKRKSQLDHPGRDCVGATNLGGQTPPAVANREHSTLREHVRPGSRASRLGSTRRFEVVHRQTNALFHRSVSVVAFTGPANFNFHSSTPEKNGSSGSTLAI